MSLEGGARPPTRARSEWTVRSSSALAIRVGALVLGLAAGSCAQVLDADRSQCSEPADCATLFGGEASDFMCVENLCRTIVDCRVSEECTNNGKLDLCIGGTCVECAVDGDCDSPTATCVAGTCEDPVWGCIDDVDTTPNAQPAATYTVKTIQPLSSGQQASVVVKPCLDSVTDAFCNLSYPNASAQWDERTGAMTVSGIPNGSPFFIKADPTDPSLYPIAYYTNRLARNTFMPTTDLFIVPRAVLNSFGGTRLVQEKSILTLRILNCKGELAAGVKFTVTPADGTLFYSDESRTGGTGLTETTRSGEAGFVNASPEVLTTVTAIISDKLSIKFQFIPLPNRWSSVELYPGVFPR